MEGAWGTTKQKTEQLFWRGLGGRINKKPNNYFGGGLGDATVKNRTIILEGAWGTQPSKTEQLFWRGLGGRNRPPIGGLGENPPNLGFVPQSGVWGRIPQILVFSPNRGFGGESPKSWFLSPIGGLGENPPNLGFYPTDENSYQIPQILVFIQQMRTLIILTEPYCSIIQSKPVDSTEELFEHYLFNDMHALAYYKVYLGNTQNLSFQLVV